MGRWQVTIVITVTVPPPMPSKAENPPRSDARLALEKPLGISGAVVEASPTTAS
jgi:hypothetical protein